MRCSVHGCPNEAVGWLRFEGMGEHLHAHVCPPCEAIDREHADVIESGQLPCPPRLRCTAEPVLTAVPTLLAP